MPLAINLLIGLIIYSIEDSAQHEDKILLLAIVSHFKGKKTMNEHISIDRISKKLTNNLKISNSLC